MHTHYGTRSSSSAPLTDEEWQTISAYADNECARIKPINLAAYRATVIARQIEQTINDRAMVKAFAARVVDASARGVEVVQGEEIERNTPAALAAMRAGIEQGRKDRALLARMIREQASDPAWR